MEPNIISISSESNNIRQDVYPMDNWTITTRKGIILQSKCACKSESDKSAGHHEGATCNLCHYHKSLPNLTSLPDMLFNNNLLRLEHYSGVGIEFNALDALKCVEATKDPLKVAVADGWQCARADFPFAKSIIKPFDWTFTTTYKGSLLTSSKKELTGRVQTNKKETHSNITTQNIKDVKSKETNHKQNPCDSTLVSSLTSETQRNLKTEERLSLKIEETSERIDVNKLKVREEILFYDDVTLYEDELADHGTAEYSVKVRVMPKSLFILSRFYLRVDGVLARINDTRIYHELGSRYLLREFTNREAKLSALNLPVSVVISPNELMNHLPVISSSYEKLTVPRLM